MKNKKEKPDKTKRYIELWLPVEKIILLPDSHSCFARSDRTASAGRVTPRL